MESAGSSFTVLLFSREFPLRRGFVVPRPFLSLSLDSELSGLLGTYLYRNLAAILVGCVLLRESKAR